MLARRLAARVAVRLTRSGAARSGGIGRLQRVRWEPGSDLDVDASLDALVTAKASGHAVDVEALRASAWRRTTLALCLVVDRSGSVSGARLASAALAAAAVALRAPDDYSVVVFSDRSVVVKSQDVARPTDAVVDDVLALRGHGVTDLAAALDTARAQLARSTATRRMTVLLSDCRPTAGPDPTPYGRRIERLAVVAPADDAADAKAFAAATGARCVTLAGPADVPQALSFLSESG
ncbi:MAG TPA: vWA domain-containing protein [Mycobacteriales bacterium]